MTDNFTQKTIDTLHSNADPVEASVRQAACVVAKNRYMFEGREGLKYENLLACLVFRASEQDPSNERLSSICEESWHMVQSPIGLRNHLVGEASTIDDYIEVIKKLTATRILAVTMSADEACQMMRCQLLSLKAKYPELGLSFGYIGNCSLGCGPAYDDRSWKFFTCLSTSLSTACDVSWGGYTTAHLGRMAMAAKEMLDSWCRAQQDRLDAGEIRRVGQ